MRTVKWNPFLSGGLLFLGGMLLWASAARADVSSTNAAAILVFPKIVVDTTTETGEVTDTIIQITNTSDAPVNVRCFWVDANGHCSASGAICNPVGDPATSPCTSVEVCTPGWQETDFSFRLTPKQPISFTANKGLPNLPLSDVPNNGQFSGGSILPVGENPFVGELKCVEVDDSEQPTDKNDLKGEATIEEAEGAPATLDVDSSGYNGIGIQAIAGQNDGNNVLCLGGDPNVANPACPNGPEYNACPNILILDHFFDDATEPTDVGRSVRTHLTLVPCSEDFNNQAPITTTVQFLVFNEFEQRFSTSRPVRCFSEIVLSDIDTRPGPIGDAQSIFNVKVQGTLTGQTLIRGVADAATTYGHGLLAIAQELHCDGGSCLTGDEYSAAFVTQQRGTRLQTDYIYLPAASPPSP